MKKTFSSRAGSEAQYGPRLAGAVLHDYLENSDDALAVAYREHTTDADEEDDRLFRGYYPDTHLCVDLKLITRKPGRMPVGNSIIALLTRDGEFHYTAVENAFEKKMVVKRNAHLYEGSQVNVNKRSDGVVYPTFRYRQLLNKTISFKDYCYQAAQELIMVAGLLEE